MRKLAIALSFVFMALLISVNPASAQKSLTDVCDYDELIFEFNQKADNANRKKEKEEKQKKVKRAQEEKRFPKRLKNTSSKKITLNDDIWRQIKFGFRNHP